MVINFFLDFKISMANSLTAFIDAASITSSAFEFRMSSMFFAVFGGVLKSRDTFFALVLCRSMIIRSSTSTFLSAMAWAINSPMNPHPMRAIFIGVEFVSLFIYFNSKV